MIPPLEESQSCERTAKVGTFLHAPPTICFVASNHRPVVPFAPTIYLQGFYLHRAFFCFLKNLSGERMLTTFYLAKNDHRWVIVISLKTATTKDTSPEMKSSTNARKTIPSSDIHRYVSEMYTSIVQMIHVRRSAAEVEKDHPRPSARERMRRRVGKNWTHSLRNK